MKYVAILVCLILMRGASAESQTSPLVIDWIGSFLDNGSLSLTNREFTHALCSLPELDVHCVHNGSGMTPGFENFAKAVAKIPSPRAAVTIRHAWPANWAKPLYGKLVVIQPWEWGMLPKQWVSMSSHVDEFWVPSEYVRQLFINSGVPAKKIVVIHSGIDTKKFHPQVNPMPLATKKKFRFLFVGGTIWRKGPDLLLQAYLKTFTAKDDVCLVIKDFGTKTFYTGQTIGQQILAAQSKTDAPEILYIDREFSFEELPGIYTACHCLVNPYRGEGFSLPTLEAMGCGLPVIVTAGGATDDFAKDFGYRISAKRLLVGNFIAGLELVGNGWVFDPNLDDLGKTMRYVFENQKEAETRGAESSHYVSQNFSWEHAARLMKERIDLLTKER